MDLFATLPARLCGGGSQKVCLALWRRSRYRAEQTLWARPGLKLNQFLLAARVVNLPRALLESLFLDCPDSRPLQAVVAADRHISPEAVINHVEVPAREEALA